MRYTILFLLFFCVSSLAKDLNESDCKKAEKEKNCQILMKCWKSDLLTFEQQEKYLKDCRDPKGPVEMLVRPLNELSDVAKVDNSKKQEKK